MEDAWRARGEQRVLEKFLAADDCRHPFDGLGKASIALWDYGWMVLVSVLRRPCGSFRGSGHKAL
jgi:hypothetical protein